MYTTNLDRVTKLTLEEAIRRVVLAQGFFTLNEEFLKVQSIIARTLLIRNMRIYGGRGCLMHDGCDVCDEGHCIEIMKEDEFIEFINTERGQNIISKVDYAIKETRGLIITKNKKPIKALYTHTCGGSTENSEDVLGNRILYLRKVLCDHCKDSPFFKNTKEINMDELEKKLGINLKGKNKEYLLGIIDKIFKDERGRINKINMCGREFKGVEIKKLLNLNSTNFFITPKSLLIETKGEGHGLGLCQYGGSVMAEKGYNYREIINYYYTGVEITSIYTPCIKKPLLGKIIMIDPGHGGKDSLGNIGDTGLLEKDVVLNISKFLLNELEDMGSKTYITREKDRLVPLSDRVDKCKDIMPHLFLSIHLNGFHNSSVKGAEGYYYKGDLQGKALGESILEQLSKDLSIINRGVKEANFYILRQIPVNCLWLEVDYITNPAQEMLLSKEDYLRKVSKSIADGIRQYYLIK